MKPDGAEHAEAAGLADRDDDVAAVGEGEDRELDAEVVTEWVCAWKAPPVGVDPRSLTGTCSS